MDDGQLIDLVRQFPVLYDKREKNFRNKLMKQNAWSTIANILSDSASTSSSMTENFTRKFLSILMNDYS